MAAKKKTAQRLSWPSDMGGQEPERLDIEKIRGILTSASDVLERDYGHGTTARFVAACIRRYLSGEANTLDEAFDLSNRRGRRVVNKARDMKITKEYLRFRESRRGKERGARSKFIEGLTEKFSMDGRRIERIVKKYENEARWALSAEKSYRRRRRIFKTGPSRKKQS